MNVTLMIYCYKINHFSFLIQWIRLFFSLFEQMNHFYISIELNFIMCKFCLEIISTILYILFIKVYAFIAYLFLLFSDYNFWLSKNQKINFSLSFLMKNVVFLEILSFAKSWLLNFFTLYRIIFSHLTINQFLQYVISF